MSLDFCIYLFNNLQYTCENLESETKLGRLKKESMHLIQFHQTNSNVNKVLLAGNHHIIQQ